MLPKLLRMKIGEIMEEQEQYNYRPDLDAIDKHLANKKTADDLEKEMRIELIKNCIEPEEILHEGIKDDIQFLLKEIDELKWVKAAIQNNIKACENMTLSHHAIVKELSAELERFAKMAICKSCGYPVWISKSQPKKEAHCPKCKLGPLQAVYGQNET